MGVYDAQIATAKRLIGKKGRACVWRDEPDGATLDTDKPWKVTPDNGASPDNGHNVRIVFLPDTRGQMSFLQTLSDSAIVVGDDYGLMAAVDFVPTVGAKIYDDTGDTLLRVVKSVDTLAPNGDIILHTVSFEVSP